MEQSEGGKSGQSRHQRVPPSYRTSLGYSGSGAAYILTIIQGCDLDAQAPRTMNGERYMPKTVIHKSQYARQETT